MGVSTNAILFYGFCVEDGSEYPWEDEKYDGIWDEWMAEILGVPHPEADWDNIPKSEQDKLWDEYRERKNAIMGDCPVDIVYYCSDSYTMYAFGIKSTVKTAHRGYPQYVPPQLMSIPSKGIDVLKKFAKALGVKKLEVYQPDNHKVKHNKLGWWLVSYWG